MPSGMRFYAWQCAACRSGGAARDRLPEAGERLVLRKYLAGWNKIGSGRCGKLSGFCCPGIFGFGRIGDIG